MRLARLFGIDLVMDWSFLLIAVLLTTNVTAVFAHWHPSWGLVPCFLLALVAMLLFFASLVAHELAHSLVAKSLGMQVTNIRLFLFGGVSNIDREPPSAIGEFAMAIVGPIVSIGVGATLTIASLLLVPHVDFTDPMRTMARLGPVTTLFVWLGPLNIGVGLFNLIPGFPLDGGRVLRAIFWGVTKNLDQATRIAALIGQLVGWSFVVSGVLRFFGVQVLPFGQGPIDGLWLAFIGWFLASAAQQSLRSMRIHEALDGVIVAQLMRRAAPVVSPDTTLRAFVEDYLVARGLDAFVVVDAAGALAGLVTSLDAARVPRDAWATTTVRAVMTPADRLAVVSPNEPILDVLQALGEQRAEHLPVVRDGRVVGILDRRQLAHWLDLALASRHRATMRPA
jgi:Zn-dependent protease/CBS domain-containing protein